MDSVEVDGLVMTYERQGRGASVVLVYGYVMVLPWWMGPSVLTTALFHAA